MPYLFVDESGDFDFGSTGSRYFIFGVLSTPNPEALTTSLTALRYELLHGGQEIECFHATDDRQVVRDRVFQVLRKCAPFDLDFLVIEKAAIPEDEREPTRFYPRFGHALVETVLTRYAGNRDRIIVITDRIPLKRHRNAVEKAFKIAIRQTLGDRAFTIAHHASAAHGALQAADYCLWAVQRKWKTGDERSYGLVADLIRSEVKFEV
jgi:hypothetical protein